MLRMSQHKMVIFSKKKQIKNLEHDNPILGEHTLKY